MVLTKRGVMYMVVVVGVVMVIDVIEDVSTMESTITIKAEERFTSPLSSKLNRYHPPFSVSLMKDLDNEGMF